MKKIILVNPQIITSSWNAPWRTTDDIIIRHSLSQLSACLKEQGHEVILADFRLMRGFSKYENLLRQEKPDFVGISLHTCEHEVVLECLERTKKVNKNILTVVGGIHVTMFPELFIESGLVDFVLRGEGEISLPKLLNDHSQFPHVFYGETPDLDKISFEDRELWGDYQKRIQHKMINFPWKTPMIDMLTKRGCPWHCKFCCGPGEQNLYTKISKTGERIPFIRTRSVENVMKELSLLYDKYKFKSIIFHDDQFVLDFSWIDDFCSAMHSYGFPQKGVKFWAAVRANIICQRPDLLQKLKDAGLMVCSVGFESFSERMLKWMNKGVSLSENFRAASILKKLNIKIFANTILGTPYKDGKWYIEDDMKTLKAIKKINPFHWSYSFFSPIPGSEFYKWFLEKNLILDNSSKSFGLRCVANSNVRGVNYKLLNKLLKKYLFYRNPLMAFLIFLKGYWGKFKNMKLVK